MNLRIPSSFKKSKIAITGSNGFISTHLKYLLYSIGFKKKSIILINSNNTDYSTKSLVKKISKADYVIHLSSATGGIKYTKENMSEQLYLTMTKDLNIFQACKKAKIKKMITLGNYHAYSSNSNKGIKENDLFNGLPQTSHLGIGWSKKNLGVLSMVFSKNSNSKFIILYSANTYGPGDSLDSNYGHVIPSLIIKCLQNKNIRLFGGKNAVREFIYVKDLVKIIVMALIKINKSCYLNVGSDEKIRIKDLINLIANLSNFNKKIIFQNKIKDISKRYAYKNEFKRLLNYKNEYNLKTGLMETIKWYKKKLKK